MPRYDKYDPINGGFRAALAADLTFDATGQFGPIGVSLDANGRVVVGMGGQAGGVGILVKNVPLSPNLGSIAGAVQATVPIGGKAGNIVDIMTSGEIILDGAGLAAGTIYYCNAGTGALETTAPGAGVNKYKAGHTVEATRLVVRFQQVQG